MSFAGDNISGWNWDINRDLIKKKNWQNMKKIISFLCDCSDAWCLAQETWSLVKGDRFGLRHPWRQRHTRVPETKTETLLLLRCSNNQLIWNCMLKSAPSEKSLTRRENKIFLKKNYVFIWALSKLTLNLPTSMELSFELLSFICYQDFPIFNSMLTKIPF